MNVRGLCTKYGICTHDYYECACLKINIFSVDQVEYTKNSILTSKNKLPMRMNNKDIELFMYVHTEYVRASNVSCTICRCRLLSNSATASRDCDDDDDGESEEENLRHEKKSFKEPVDIDTDRTETEREI